MPEVIKDWFTALPRQQKISFVVLASIFLVVPLVALLLLSRESFRPLISDVPATDMARIVELVEQQGVSYRLDASGTAIEVPDSALANLRMQLASAGLPGHGHVGFEIFADSDYGRSDFSQKVNYMRAMQGELARTIMALPQVKDARVHLVLPEKSLFKSAQAPASASITVIEAQKGALGADQVRGIQRLVAAAIRDMQPGDVVVLTNSGVVLSSDAAADEQVSVRLKSAAAELEQDIENKAARVLKPFLQRSDFALSATVLLDYDKYRLRREEPISSQEQGLVANQKIHTRTDKTAAQGKDNGSAKTTREEETRYALGSQIEEREVDRQVVRRISIALVLPAGLDAAQQEQAADLVRHAAGLDIERGDDVYVSLMGATANDDEVSVPSPPPTEQTIAPQWQVTALIAGVAFVVALLLGRLWPRRRSLRDAEAEALARELQQWLRAEPEQARD